MKKYKTEGYRSPLRAIREKCIDCMCGYVPEVKRCPSTNCPLWIFRFGKNPTTSLSRKNKDNVGGTDDETLQT